MPSYYAYQENLFKRFYNFKKNGVEASLSKKIQNERRMKYTGKARLR